MTPAATGQPFVRAWLVTTSAQASILVVYIEGDGAPWPASNLPPGDPTPPNPLALRLAAAHDGATVAYLGRPCQYLDDATLRECDGALWAGARYGTSALKMVNDAIDALAAATGARRLALVGYSGGGAIAALLAGRRADVSCVVTIAAPLDTEAWSRMIDVSPLKASFNPAESPAGAQPETAVHFTGGRDRVVPPESIRKYLDRHPRSSEIRIADFGHDCCWVRDWTRLRRQTCLD
jgi:pimeloyl-ACP methyl ester carboxylesterase